MHASTTQFTPEQRTVINYFFADYRGRPRRSTLHTLIAVCGISRKRTKQAVRELLALELLRVELPRDDRPEVIKLSYRTLMNQGGAE